MFDEQELDRLVKERMAECRREWPHAPVGQDGGLSFAAFRADVVQDKLMEAFKEIELLKERIIRLENGK